MIRALDTNANYLMTARWFKREEILQPNPNGEATPTAGGVTFRCRLLGEIRNTDNYIVRNLVSDGATMRIETLANYDFKHNDYIYLNDKWWLIDELTLAEKDEREKSLGVVRLKYGNIKRIMHLVEDEI